MEQGKYRSYSAEMFVEDMAFRRWVKSKSSPDQLFWSAFLIKYPDQKVEVERAVSILEALHGYYREDYSGEEIEGSFRRVKYSIEQRKPSRFVSFRNSRRIAAGVAIFLGLALSYLYVSNSATPTFVEHVTINGEQKRIALPDGTTVVLNANSALHFDLDWTVGETREVLLQGEAYFDVMKDLSKKAKFVVHVEGLDVEVFGTQFNVNSRKNVTEVALEEGSIQIRFEDSLGQQNLVMVPGDVISYEISERKVDHINLKTERYTSWKDGTLLFRNDLLSEVMNDLADIYGIRYRLDHQLLRDKRISGGVPIENLEIALETLSGLYGLKVELSGGIYIISQ